MFRSAPDSPNIVTLRFGGGVNTRTSEDEINIREAADGYNFDLDLENSHFEPRKPFQLMGTATNAEDIRGFAQLRKADGTLSTLIQAGDTVYSWDGASTFTSVGTVKAGAKLRGPLHQNFNLDDEVFITDLNLIETVKRWDGTTFEDLPHNLSADAGQFYAKYGWVRDERAFFANVKSGTATPHMIVGSKREVYGTTGGATEGLAELSTSDKPSSALGDADPFYILTPDLKPINGLVESFGRFVISSRYGSMFYLDGGSAKDFAIKNLYPDSASVGDESIVFAGNDAIYARHGAIESLSGSDTFGDVENDDLSRQIANVISGFEEFRLVYDTNKKRVYVFPKESDTIWVFHKPIYDQSAKDVTLLRPGQQLSPWTSYKTNHSVGFQPTTVWSMYDPQSGRPRVYFGGTDGKIFAFESDTYEGDGGTTDVVATRTSKNFPPPQGTSEKFSGWIRYRGGSDVTLQLEVLFGGVNVLEQAVTITLPAGDNQNYFGGDVYFGGTFYYGALYEGKIRQQEWTAAGRSSEFQLRATVTSSNSFSVAEVGIEFEG